MLLLTAWQDCVNTRQAVYVWRNSETRSCNHCCHGKAISIIYSEFVLVALVIQHAICMRCCILPSDACPPLIYFSTLSHSSTIFAKQLLNIKSVFWFSLQLLSEMFRFLRTKQDTCMFINVYWSSCEIPAILSDLIKLKFSPQIFEKYSY